MAVEVESGTHAHIVLTAFLTVSQRNDAHIQIVITVTELTRISFPISLFNQHFFGINFAILNKIHPVV